MIGARKLASRLALEFHTEQGGELHAHTLVTDRESGSP
jgi:hypothetical protein